ncbi:MAG: hypothetical protein AABZ12_05770 [Planctomycetota bacterium]
MMVRNLNLWVGQHARGRAATLPERFVDTKVAKDLYAIARLVREDGTMGLSVGPTGIGKTRCAPGVPQRESLRRLPTIAYLTFQSAID